MTTKFRRSSANPHKPRRRHVLPPGCFGRRPLQEGMMPKSEASPVVETKSAAQGLIERFRTAYAPALADAEVSAEHTQTEGWQRLYGTHRESGRAKRREIAKRLRRLATQLEDFGWSEEDEKSVKDAAKESAELTAEDAVFDREAVDRVRAPVQKCERIVREFVGEAERVERDAPLHAKGTTDALKSEIATHRHPDWSDETGMVVMHAANN